MIDATTEMQFTMHPHLLWSVIHKQAGAAWKAVMEGVMNSVDAQATRCDITISATRITIVDDGRGFKDKAEVEQVFGTFGLPHEEGDATYGAFRMGRGQLFAYGKNVWSSNGLEMTVDLKPQKDKAKSQALSFFCGETPEIVRGCRIEIQLYETLLPSGIEDLVARLSKAVAWSSVPITINGKVRSKDPAAEKWDIVTDDAYVKLKTTNTVAIYNLGCFVTDESAYRFGSGGVVVSKTRLDVNFARNAVQGTCPVWRRIMKLFGDRTKREAKPRKMTDALRAHTVATFLSGEIAADAFINLVVLEAGNGSRISPRGLMGHMREGLCAMKPVGDRAADILHTRGSVATLSEDCVAMFGCSTALETFQEIAKRCGSSTVEAAFIKAVSGLREATPDDLENLAPNGYAILERKNLKAAERAALDIIEHGASPIALFFAGARNMAEYPERAKKSGIPHNLLNRFDLTRRWSTRRIEVGSSCHAEAWTDGSTSIVIERKMLPLAACGREGMNRLVGLLIHEYLHDTPSSGTHLHDEEFYKVFHDIHLDSGVVGTAVDRMLERWCRLAQSKSKRVTGLFRKHLDRKAIEEHKGVLAFDDQDLAASVNYPVLKDGARFPESEGKPG